MSIILTDTNIETALADSADTIVAMSIQAAKTPALWDLKLTII